MMREEEDDEETLFDQDSLLKSGSVKFSGPSEWSRRCTKTFVLSMAFFALGLCMAIPGPTLLDLGDRVGASTEKMSYIFPARSAGYLFGSIIGGFLFDRFDQQILLFYTLFLTAVATSLAPWCTSLVVLAIMMSFQGLSMGVLDTGGNVFCIKIWGRKSGPYMQVVHFAFAIGAFVAPLLARPFLLTHANATITNMSVSMVGPPILTKLPNPSGNMALVGKEPFSRHPRNIPDLANLTSAGIKSTLGNDTDQDLNITSVTTISSLTTKAFRKPKVLSAHDEKGVFADGTKISDKIQGSRGIDNPETVPANNLSTISPTLLGNTVISNISHTENNTQTKSNISVTNTASTTTESFIITAIHKSSVPTISIATPTTTTIPTTTKISTPTTTTITTTKSPTTTTKSPTTTLAKTSILTTKSIDHLTSSSTVMKQSTVVSADHDNSSANESTPTRTMSSPVSNLSETTPTVLPKKPQTIGDFVNSAIDTITHMSKIQFAYLIIGVLLMANSFMFLILYCKDRNRPSIFCRDEDHDSRYGKESQFYRYTMLFFLFIFFFVYVGMEVTYGGLLLTFAVEKMKWNKSKSAVLTSIFWGSLAAGRGFAIFIARCFKPPCMLVIDLVLVVVGGVILSFGLSYMESLLWAGSLIIGLGMSSIFPTGVTWADQYFPLTGKSTAVLIVGSALGEMLIPVITGTLYENYDKMYLMYVMLALSAVLTVMYLSMQCFASKNKQFAPSSHNGFLPLQEDENVPMDSFEGSGLLETSRHRKSHPKPANMEVEYSRLIDVDS